MTHNKSKSFAYFIVACLYVAISAGSANLLAQQSDTENHKLTESRTETKEVRGKVMLQGKELKFSSLEELETITQALREDHSKNNLAIPNYFEMKAVDITASKTFYESAFGFKFVDFGKEYSVVTSGPISIGFALGKEPSAPMPAFQTFDIEASLKAVKAAKGKIEKAIFAFPGGKRFEFLDPSGNRIAVFQNN